MVDRVLKDEDHTAMMDQYRNWMKAAALPPPDRPQLPKDPVKRAKIMEAHAKKYAEYESNPGLAIRASAIEEVKKKYGYTFDPRTQKFTSSAATPELQAEEIENANNALEGVLASKEKLFEEGLSKGKSGDFSLAMQKFFSLDFMGGIKEALKAIPFVGDFLIAPGKMLKRLVTTGKLLGPVAAYGEAKHERALGGGLEALGITDPKQVESYTSVAINKSVAPVTAGETPTPKPETGPGAEMKTALQNEVSLQNIKQMGVNEIPFFGKIDDLLVPTSTPIASVVPAPREVKR